ncbi:MAG: DUF932 domain-containing protein [Conexivisphaera sp.]
MTPNMDMGMPAVEAGKAVEGSGSGAPAISGGITLPGRRFRVEKEDHQWADYGIVRYYGVFVDETGEETPRRYQLVVINTKHPGSGRPVKATIVKSPSFHLIPNEVALEIANKVAAEAGLRPTEVAYTSNGLGVYARYVSERTQDVTVGDLIAVGFQMKNGIDGSMSHLYTGYTLRLVCSNGMIAPADQVGFKVGTEDPTKAEDVVRNNIQGLIEMLQEEVDLYRSWTRIQMNMRLARMLAAALPKSYLTNLVEFDKKTREVTNVKLVTVWEAFNMITDPLTHRRIEERHRDWLRVRLRRVMGLWQAVENGHLSEEDAMGAIAREEE